MLLIIITTVNGLVLACSCPALWLYSLNVAVKPFNLANRSVVTVTVWLRHVLTNRLTDSILNAPFCVCTVEAVLGWGQTLQKWYGRNVDVDRQLDISTDYIGYYTDRGYVTTCSICYYIFSFRSDCSTGHYKSSVSYVTSRIPGRSFICQIAHEGIFFTYKLVRRHLHWHQCAGLPHQLCAGLPHQLHMVQCCFCSGVTRQKSVRGWYLLGFTSSDCYIAQQSDTLLLIVPMHQNSSIKQFAVDIFLWTIINVLTTELHPMSICHLQLAYGIVPFRSHFAIVVGKRYCSVRPTGTRFDRAVVTDFVVGNVQCKFLNWTELLIILSGDTAAVNA